MLFSKVLALAAAAGVSGAGLGKKLGHGLGHGDLKGRQGKLARS